MTQVRQRRLVAHGSGSGTRSPIGLTTRSGGNSVTRNHRNAWARDIKRLIFTDDGVGLIHLTGPSWRGWRGKYAPLVPVLRDLIGLPDTPLSGDAKEHICVQLNSPAERFAA